MKYLIPLLILVAGHMVHADALWNAYQHGIASCGVKFKSVNPNSVASRQDFPGIKYSPPPTTSTTVVGEYHFQKKGELECGKAAGKLVKVPAAQFACSMSLGVYIPRLAGGASVGATAGEAAKKMVQTCVKNLGYVKPCLDEWVTCLSR